MLSKFICFEKTKQPAFDAFLKIRLQKLFKPKLENKQNGLVFSSHKIIIHSSVLFTDIRCVYRAVYTIAF